MESDLFHFIVTLHVSSVTAPIIRSTKFVTAAFSTGHSVNTRIN